MSESFPDTELDILESAIARYKEIGAYAPNPVMKEEAFEMLQTVMTEAGELENKAPYDKVVNNTFAEEAVRKIKP